MKPVIELLIPSMDPLMVADIVKLISENLPGGVHIRVFDRHGPLGETAFVFGMPGNDSINTMCQQAFNIGVIVKETIDKYLQEKDQMQPEFVPSLWAQKVAKMNEQLRQK